MLILIFNHKPVLPALNGLSLLIISIAEVGLDRPGENGTIILEG